MLNKAVLDTIDSIESTEEFEEVLNRFQTSNADIEVKKEAIKELKARKSCFDTSKLSTDASVLSDIQAGQADIDDIG